MTALWGLVDGVTDTAATFAVRADTGSIRIAVSTESSLANAVYSAASSPANGMVKATIGGLAPDTEYWWAPEFSGVLDTDTLGRFRTNPAAGTPMTLTLRAFSCAGGEADYPGVMGDELVPERVSNSPGFTDVQAVAAHRTIHMGDWTYYNLGSDAFGIVGGGSLTNYRKMFDDFARQPRQRGLYLNAATVFVADDHEGPNDHDRTYEGLPNLRTVFSERVPHATLPVPGTLYREETIGQTLILYLDGRSARDPNSTPDGPGKTMLGSAQRGRISATLASSTAKFLVIVSASVWHEPGREDGWWAFGNEQQWLISELNGNGWAGRCVVISGDVHALGMDSGTNSPGGIPCATFASIDSDFGSPLTHNDRGPTLPGRRQFGTVRIVDTGDHIEVTLTGYTAGNVWDTFSFGFDVTDDDGEDPGPVLPPPAVPDLTRNVEWYACDLVTGDKIARLPALTGTISRALGAYTQDTLTIPVVQAGPAAMGALLDQATDVPTVMIVCIVHGIPVWGGIPLKPKGGSESTLALGCVSIEGYLDRRFVGDHEWTGRDEASVIAAGLVADAQVNGIGLLVDAPATGTLRDRTYHDDEDATVYQRLTELMEVEDGPEWTIDLAWKDSKERSIAKIFRMRKRIGTATARVTLATKSKTAAKYTYSRDYSADQGANDVLATSSGEGSARPASQHFRHDVPGIPRFERRFQPSSSIKDPNVLNAHARAELARTANGATAVEITARWNIEPARLGIDVNLGDQIEYALYGPMHPLGLLGEGRMVGWRLDPQAGTYQPVLRA